MPLPDVYTLQAARSYMSGKECLPSQLVLGAALQYLNSDKYRKDETYLLFVPTTTGPCRTGQYYIFYENLFRDLRIDNVVVIVITSYSIHYTKLYETPASGSRSWPGRCRCARRTRIPRRRSRRLARQCPAHRRPGLRSSPPRSGR